VDKLVEKALENDHEKSLDWINRLIDVYPKRYLLLYLKTLILLEKARFGEAIQAAEASLEYCRNGLTLANLSIAGSLGGAKQEGLRTLAACEEEYRRSGGEDASFLALAHYETGHRERAFRWLEQAYRDHDISLVDLSTDPLWGELH
jgi:tetratricopeptide (TPR) repeat protein